MRIQIGTSFLTFVIFLNSIQSSAQLMDFFRQPTETEKARTPDASHSSSLSSQRIGPHSPTDDNESNAQDMNHGSFRPPPIYRPPSPQRIDSYPATQNNGQHQLVLSKNDNPPFPKNHIAWTGDKINIETKSGEITRFDINPNIYGDFHVRVKFEGSE